MTERLNKSIAHTVEPTYGEFVHITDTMAVIAQEAIWVVQNHAPLSEEEALEIYAKGAEADLTQQEFLDWGTELSLIPGAINEDGSFQTKQAA